MCVLFAPPILISLQLTLVFVSLSGTSRYRDWMDRCSIPGEVFLTRPARPGGLLTSCSMGTGVKRPALGGNHPYIPSVEVQVKVDFNRTDFEVCKAVFELQNTCPVKMCTVPVRWHNFCYNLCTLKFY
jgi:hypothetical protein